MPNRRWITALRFLLLASLVLLVIQYILGTYVNAYASPPYAGALFDSHYLVGVLLVILAIIVLAFSALSRSVPAITTSALALIFILVAGQAGRMFAYSGQHSLYTVLMSLSFLAAFASYFSEELVLRRMMNAQRLQTATGKMTQPP